MITRKRETDTYGILYRSRQLGDGVAGKESKRKKERKVKRRKRRKRSQS